MYLTNRHIQNIAPDSCRIQAKHGKVIKLDNLLACKKKFKFWKSFEIPRNKLLNHSAIKLTSNNKKVTKKEKSKTYMLGNLETFLNDLWVKEGIIREIRKYLELNDNRDRVY